MRPFLFLSLLMLGAWPVSLHAKESPAPKAHKKASKKSRSVSFVGKSLNHAVEQGAQVTLSQGWDGTTIVNTDVDAFSKTAMQDTRLASAFTWSLVRVKVNERDLILLNRSPAENRAMVVDQLQPKVRDDQTVSFTACEHGVCCGDARVVVYKRMINEKTQKFERVHRRVACTYNGD